MLLIASCAESFRMNHLKRRTCVYASIAASEFKNLPMNMVEQSFTKMGDDGTVFSAVISGSKTKMNRKDIVGFAKRASIRVASNIFMHKFVTVLLYMSLSH